VTQYTLKPTAVARARVVSITKSSGVRTNTSGLSITSGTQGIVAGETSGPSKPTSATIYSTTLSGPTQGTWTLPGGGTGVTSVNDVDDNTYLRKTSTIATDLYSWALGTFTLPANECVVRFKWRVRMKRPLATSKFSAFFYTKDGGYTPAKDLVFGQATFTGTALTIGWVEGPWVSWPSPGEKEMTQAQIDDLCLAVTDGATTATAATYLYAVEIVVETTTRPKVSITSQGGAYHVITKQLSGNVVTLTTDVPHSIPSGASVTVVNLGSPYDGTYTLTGVTATTMTYAKVAGNTGPTATTGQVRAGFVVSDTRRPLLSWAITDADGDSQSSVDVIVYSEAVVTQYGAAFAPGKAGIPYVWRYQSISQGVVDNTPGRYVEESLSQGGQYRVYIQAATHPSVTGSLPGFRSGVNAQEWQYLLFTVQAATPPAAEVTITPDTAIKANRVQGTARVNLLTANIASLETGATTGWAVGTTCTLSVVSGGLAKSGTYALAMTATGVGSGFMSANSERAAVVAGQVYSITVATRTAVTARSARVDIYWYDINDGYLGQTNGTGSTNSTSYTTRTVTATAPALAAYARVIITITGQAASEVHYFDEIALHPGSVPAYSPGGATSASVVVEAIGVGQLLDVVTSTLSTTSGTGGVQASAKRSRSGLSQVVKAAGATTVSTPVGVSGVRSVPGAVMTFAARIASESSTTLSMILRPYDAAGTALAASTVNQAVTAGVLTAVSGTYTMPANTAFVALEFSTTLASDFYVDDMLLTFGSVTPTALLYAPARRRFRALYPAIESGLFDYVDEGAPVDNVPTVYFIDTLTDGGSNSSGPAGFVSTINGTLDWSMRVLSAPERNVFDLDVQGPSVSEDRDEQTEVHWTLGSDYPTVLSGPLGGADGTLEIRTETDTEWAALTDALTAQSTIVLHRPVSVGPRGAEPKYIRVTRQAWRTEKYGARTYRTVNLSYIETEPF
jgi:hypothetical protein